VSNVNASRDFQFVCVDEYVGFVAYYFRTFMMLILLFFAIEHLLFCFYGLFVSIPLGEKKHNSIIKLR